MAPVPLSVSADPVPSLAAGPALLRATSSSAQRIASAVCLRCWACSAGPRIGHLIAVEARTVWLALRPERVRVDAVAPDRIDLSHASPSRHHAARMSLGYIR